MTTPARAVPIDPYAEDGVAAIYAVSVVTQTEALYILCTDGETWQFLEDNGLWGHRSDLPVPVTEIADWTPFFIQTSDGAFWWKRAWSEPWQVLDATECVPPIESKKQSLGSVKELYR